MKLLLTTVLTLGLLAFTGCEDESTPAPAAPNAEAHSEGDGHDHTNESKPEEARGEDHSGHDH